MSFVERFFLLSGLALFVFGCAGFSNGMIPQATAWKNETSNASALLPIVQFTNHWSVAEDGVPVEPDRVPFYRLPEVSEEIFDTTFRESNLFVRVKGESVADYILNLNSQLDIETKFGNIYVSALTAFIVPQYGRSVHRLHLTVAEKDGVVIGEISKQDGVSQITEILLLPLTPFISPGAVETRVFRNSVQSLLQDLKERGWIKPI